MTNSRHSKYVIFVIASVIALLTSCANLSSLKTKNSENFSFIVFADTRESAAPEFRTSQYFQGACEAILNVGKGAFIISPGDTDPPQFVHEVIRDVLGNDYPWYPAIGNHEAETEEDMIWLRNYGKSLPNISRKGPSNSKETTYAFNHGNAHFVVLNEYYDGLSDTGTKHNVADSLYHWLKNDLEHNKKSLVFVFGHAPLLALPDIDTGRHRHLHDSLNAYPENNHRFQKLLRDYQITAYFCGHTHGASYAFLNGVWQIDVGHARGIMDTGTPSTFFKIDISGLIATVKMYRDDMKGGPYKLSHKIILEN
ncbi:MAG: metallophosphoesterase [Candidatus Marinimicrobia bacterium]|nr:metallophosphoesterase [Candidatus Neomarinimicrobiota bacterium]